MATNSLARAQDKIRSMRDSFNRKRHAEKNSVRSVTHKAIAGGSAFALAYYQHRFPERAEIMGAPVSLVVGGVGLLAELMGWGGGESDMIGAIGGGGLDCYAALKGAEMGDAAKTA
jgi:hypothetical protein